MGLFGTVWADAQLPTPMIPMLRRQTRRIRSDELRCARSQTDRSISELD
jgi:hypothetical protein